jgi:hypothetical protein
VRLRSKKCTIGSDPACTLRLRARGVGPVHCLIVRGGNGAVIRRWSLDTRLNGSAFSEALLVPGDRLSIGRIELDVLATGRAGEQDLLSQSTPAAPCGCSGRADEAARPGDDTARELQSLRAELESRRRELDLRQSALDEQRRQLDLEQSRRDAQGDRADAAPDCVSKPPVEGEELAAMAHDTTPAAEPPVVPEYHPVSPQSPVNLADIFSRLGIQGNEPSADTASAVVEDPAEPIQPAGHAAANHAEQANAGDGEDESIQAYMKQLMARVRGTSESGEPPRCEAPAVRPPKSTPDVPAVRTPAEAGEPARAATPRPEPVQMSPRTVAPEKQVDLSAMRELANLSAENALNRHAHRKLRDTSHAKLAVTVVALAAGIGLYWIGKLPGAKSAIWYGAGASFLVSLVWGAQYFLLTANLILRSFRRLRKAAKETAAKAEQK